jgi:hypothetical protein
MSDSGHPSRHGFVLCGWCRTWRRASETAMREGEPECADRTWCTGEIERRGQNRPEFARSHPDSPVVLGEDESSTTANPGALGGIPRGPVLNGEVK